jgi:hypothetical protein
MTYTQDPPPEGSERFWTHVARIEQQSGCWSMSLLVKIGGRENLVEHGFFQTEVEAERIAKEWVGLETKEE